MRGSVRLLSWNAEEAAAHEARLREAGFDVTNNGSLGPALWQEMADAPPGAIVVDLDRRPSVGRDVAVSLRCRKGTRHLPLVFAGGDPEKVAGVRAILPDAAYAPWDTVADAVAAVIADPPQDPVVPSSVFAGYEGASPAKKLGIRARSTVALLGAPEGFAATLGELPDGVAFRDAQGACGLTLLFVRSPEELSGSIGTAVIQSQHGPVWIVWPKQAGGARTGLSQQRIRDAGLSNGLVDYKVCSVDATWSGLLFKRRG